MDKFGGAFSQAKHYAEKGRTHVNAGLNKVDTQWQQRQRSSSQPQDPNDPTSSSAPPPPPPASRSSPIPPVSRTRAPSYSTTSSPSAGVFSNLSQTEKQAFFQLLDEYFLTRPHLSHLFTQTSNEEIENLSSFPRRGPLPTHTTPTPAASRAPAPPPPVATPVVPDNALGQCTALYDYSSEDPDDLNFNEGDRITLIEIVSDDWWKGELRGKRGIFPSNYAQRS
ncbi:hypothetical protein JCM16303_004071 [Sporobolomyces ruberrimus]